MKITGIFTGKKRLKTFAIASALAVFLVMGVIGYADRSIERVSSGKIFKDPDLLPEYKTALLLGCARKTKDGWDNYYFNYRIDAAAELFRKGKVKYILVSGDNGRKTYDEASDMREALIGKGVPKKSIIRDYAGFRTLDSVVRAKEVFQENKFIIISQQFHVERALYLARSRGIQAIGYCARDLSSGHTVTTKTRLREKLARVKAVLDIILNTQPKYLGEKITIG